MILSSRRELRPGVSKLLLPTLVLALAAASLLLSACAEQEPDEAQDGRLKVVVSLAIFGDFARQVGGDQVDVFAIIPAGADPHTFEPSPKTAQKIAEADIVFINGWGVEAQLKDLVEENVRQGVFVLPFTASGPMWDPYPTPPDQPKWIADPHRWLWAENAIFYVQTISGHLSVVDPENATYYESNAEAYIAELTALDQEIEAKLSVIPPARRKLVTFHDSFQRFAYGYGLEVVAVVTSSPGQEPSAKDVASLVDAIRDQDVPAVFKEPQFNARILELAAGDAGVEVCTLYSDSLDDRVPSYLDLMRFNAEELVRCLG